MISCTLLWGFLWGEYDNFVLQRVVHVADGESDGRKTHTGLTSSYFIAKSWQEKMMRNETAAVKRSF